MNIYFVKMDGLMLIVGKVVLFSKFEFLWEMICFCVNEVFVVIVCGECVFISYLVSGIGVEYCFGLFSVLVNVDLFDLWLWMKLFEFVFRMNEVNGIFGFGYN